MYRRARKSVVMQTMGHQLVRRHSDVALATLQQPLESQLTTQEQPPSGDGSSEESSSGISSSGVSFSSDCSSPGSRVTAILAETESLPSSRVSHRRSIPMDYRLLAGMRSMPKVPAPVHSLENRKRKTTSENPPSPVDNAVKKLKITDDSCRSPSKTASVTTLWNKDTDASLAWVNNECEKYPLLPSASHCENECAVVDNRVVTASDVPLVAADCVSVSAEDCANDGDCCAKENWPISVHSQKNCMEACYGTNRPKDCRCADNNEEQLGSTNDYQNSDSVSDIVPGDLDPVAASTDCELQEKNCCLFSDKPQDGGSCSSSSQVDHEKLNCPSDAEHASQRSHISRLFSSDDLHSTSFTADNLQLCKEHQEGGNVTEQKESCDLSDAVHVSRHSDTKQRLLAMPNKTDYCQSENTFLKSYLGFCLQGSSSVQRSTSRERPVNCNLVKSIGELPTVSPTEPSGLSSHFDSKFRASCSALRVSQSSAGAVMPANPIESCNGDFKISSETLKPLNSTEKLTNVDCKLVINDMAKFPDDCDELANTTVSHGAFLDHQISCPENFCSIEPFAIPSDTNKNTAGNEKTALLVTKPASCAVSSMTGFTPFDIESSRQDSCCTSNRSDSPDIDTVDEVTFHSFSSKRSLQQFVRSNARNRSHDGAHNTLGPVERRCSNSIVHHWGKHRRIWLNRHTSTFTSSRRLHEQLQLGLIRPITAQQFEQLKLQTTAAPKIRRSALSSNLKNYRLERKKECQRVVPKIVPSKITVLQRTLPECRVVVNKPPLPCSPSAENTTKLSSRSRKDTKGLRLLRLTLSLATQSLEALREPRFVNSVPCNEPGCQFGCICRLFANNTFSRLVGSSVDSPSDFSISNLQLQEIGYTGRLSLSALNEPVCGSSASYNSRCSTPLAPNDDIQRQVSSSVLSMKKNIYSASRLRKKSCVRKAVKSVSRRKQRQLVRETLETETKPGQLRSCLRTKSVVSCMEQTSVGQDQVRKGVVPITPTVQQSVGSINETRTPARDTSVKNQHLSPQKTISSGQQSDDDDDCMIIDNPEPSTICRTPTRRKSIKELVTQNKTVNVGVPSVSTRSSPRKFASLFNDNGWKSRSVQRRGHGLAFRNIRPTLRINNLTPTTAAGASSSTQLSSVVSSRSTKSPSTANQNIATNPQSFLSRPSPVKVRSSQPKIKSAPFRTQMVLFQHSSRNLASGDDGVGKRRGRPCLLEITSNCEWEKVRAKILTQLAGVTIDSTSYPKTCRLLVEGFHVEILPQTDHPTALPEHLHAAVGCQDMVPIRIRITVEAKTPTVLTTTMISVLQQGKLVPVVGRSAVRDLLLSNSGIRSLVGKNGGGQQLLRSPVGQLLQDSCNRLKACRAASSDTVAASCIDARPVPPAAISESDASVVDMQLDRRDVTGDTVCDKQDGDCDGHSNSDKHIEQHSGAAASTDSSNNCLHLP